jgi:glyoxylase-like metal-dependent hydrolase (beta-lactamase superfamily II)
MAELNYEVVVSEGVPRQRAERLPDGSPFKSSPVSATLIYGERDAVLVDPPFTHEQIRSIGDRIERSGKRLTHIYATHGHGDHWFGTSELLQRFPDAVPYATAGTIAVMQKQLETREFLWDNDFPGLIGDSPLIYREVPAEGIELEGERLIPVEVGHTDTDETTVLHVPSIGLVVAGDAVYNGVHLMLLETPGGGFDGWFEALDIVESLHPRKVIAGHKNPDLPDDPAIIEQTRRYLKDAQELLASEPTPVEFYETMTGRYPTWLNPSPAWYNAHLLLGVPFPDAPAAVAESS